MALGVDIGKCNDVFVNAICCYSSWFSMPIGFNVSILGMN